MDMAVYAKIVIALRPIDGAKRTRNDFESTYEDTATVIKGESGNGRGIEARMAWRWIDVLKPPQHIKSGDVPTNEVLMWFYIEKYIRPLNADVFARASSQNGLMFGNTIVNGNGTNLNWYKREFTMQ